MTTTWEDVVVTPEEIESHLRQGGTRYNAYYYSFEPTGVEVVDRILAAVARAGKASHHTDGWSDSIDWESSEGPSYADLIQAAADIAAAGFRP